MAWTNESLAETAGVVGSAAADALAKTLRDELTQIGNHAPRERRDLDYCIELIGRLRDAERQAEPYRQAAALAAERKRVREALLAWIDESYEELLTSSYLPGSDLVQAVRSGPLRVAIDRILPEEG